MQFGRVSRKNHLPISLTGPAVIAHLMVLVLFLPRDFVHRASSPSVLDSTGSGAMLWHDASGRYSQSESDECRISLANISYIVYGRLLAAGNYGHITVLEAHCASWDKCEKHG